MKRIFINTRLSRVYIFLAFLIIGALVAANAAPLGENSDRTVTGPGFTT